LKFHLSHQNDLKVHYENHVFSVVRFKELAKHQITGKYKSGGQIKDKEMHIYAQSDWDLRYPANTHTIVLNSPKGIPVMLDRDEKSYLEKNWITLEIKHWEKAKK